jgi:hypothetical protein
LIGSFGTRSSYRINFINKNNRRRAFSSVLKETSDLKKLDQIRPQSTLEGPTPTNISMKSEPDIEKKGTPASPAVAFASRVFPVPGGPTNSAP